MVVDNLRIVRMQSGDVLPTLDTRQLKKPVGSIIVFIGYPFRHNIGVNAMKTIIAAVETESGQDNILEAAKDLAGLYNAELILVTVESELPGTEGADDEQVKAELEDAYGDDVHILQGLAQQVAEEGIDCRALIIEGTATDQLLHIADEVDADLIVIGNHHHSPLYDTLIGGALPGIIHRAKQKVLLVPLGD